MDNSKGWWIIVRAGGQLYWPMDNCTGWWTIVLAGGKLYWLEDFWHSPATHYMGAGMTWVRLLQGGGASCACP